MARPLRLRFHGAAGKYQGGYGAHGLAPVARELLAWRGGDAWVFFNNDVGGHAIFDARTLRALVDAERSLEAGAP